MQQVEFYPLLLFISSTRFLPPVLKHPIWICVTENSPKRLLKTLNLIHTLIVDEPRIPTVTDGALKAAETLLPVRGNERPHKKLRSLNATPHILMLSPQKPHQNKTYVSNLQTAEFEELRVWDEEEFYVALT